MPDPKDKPKPEPKPKVEEKVTYGFVERTREAKQEQQVDTKLNMKDRILDRYPEEMGGGVMIALRSRVHIKAGVFTHRQNDTDVEYKAEPGDLDWSKGQTVTLRFFNKDGSLARIAYVSDAEQFQFGGRSKIHATRNVYRTGRIAQLVCRASNMSKGDNPRWQPSDWALMLQGMADGIPWTKPTEKQIAEFEAAQVQTGGGQTTAPPGPDGIEDEVNGNY